MAEVGQAELDKILEKVAPLLGYGRDQPIPGHEDEHINDDETYTKLREIEEAIEDFKEKFNCTMKSDQPGGGKKRRKRRTKKRRTKKRRTKRSKSQRKSNKR